MLEFNEKTQLSKQCEIELKLEFDVNTQQVKQFEFDEKTKLL